MYEAVIAVTREVAIRARPRAKFVSWFVLGLSIGLLMVVNSQLSGDQLQLLNLGWPEICRDLERAIEFDQSQLFRKVYEEEFGTPGGEPYGLLIVDHEVRHRSSAEFRTNDAHSLTKNSSLWHILRPKLERKSTATPPP